MAFDIKEKYDKIPLPVKASFWFVVCRVIQKGISFISTPIFTRILTPEEFGAVSIFYSWEGILTVFFTIQLPSGVYNKAMIKYEKEKDQYTSSMLFFVSVLTFTFYIIYFTGRELFNSLLGLNTQLVSLLFIQIFFTSAFSFWSIRHRFNFAYKQVVLVTILTNLAGTCFSIMLLLTHPDERIVYRILGQVIVSSIVYCVLYILIIKKGKTFIRKDFWKYSVRYNLPLIPHYLSQQVLIQSDRIMIQNMCGMSYAAYYSVAYQLSMVLNILTSAIDYSFSPWAYRKIRDRNFKSLGRIVLLISTATGLLCFCFSLLGPEIVYILGGKEYATAMWVIPPVCMSVLFIMMYSLIATITFYYEKTGIIMIASCVVAGINLILNFICIQIFGFVAAGYTTLISYIIYFFIHYRIMVKTCKENIIQNPFVAKYILIISLTFVALSLISNVLYVNNGIRYAVIFTLFLSGVLLLMKNKRTLREWDLFDKFRS